MWWRGRNPSMTILKGTLESSQSCPWQILPYTIDLGGVLYIRWRFRSCHFYNLLQRSYRHFQCSLSRFHLLKKVPIIWGAKEDLVHWHDRAWVAKGVIEKDPTSVIPLICTTMIVMSSVRVSYCSQSRYDSATTAAHASRGSLNLETCKFKKKI